MKLKRVLIGICLITALSTQMSFASTVDKFEFDDSQKATYIVRNVTFNDNSKLSHNEMDAVAEILENIDMKEYNQSPNISNEETSKFIMEKNPEYFMTDNGIRYSALHYNDKALTDNDYATARDIAVALDTLTNDEIVFTDVVFFN